LRGGRFQFQGEAAFREWLYRAAPMKLVDRHRRWTAQQRDVGRERPLTPPGDQSGESFFQPVAEGGSPSEAAVQNEEFGRFEAAYAQLPERQREILRLHHVEGLPHGDIAARLGLSEANSRMLLSRALARIGRRLADG
jgi:RNA polymerase sigma-70 factor (ECF subfamily)